jgi:hypothetical protein
MAAYSGMPNPIFLSLPLLGATVLVVATLPKSVEPDPIARLDECIQHRFLSTRTFGMSRILPQRYHGLFQFQSENAVEQQVVADLTQQGYQVAIFLAGRHVLDQMFDKVMAFNPRLGLQGPAFVASTNAATALPDRQELLAESRTAMQSFAKMDEHDNGYSVHKGDWVVALRPLRATSESCVQCHTVGPGTLTPKSGGSLNTGDALGVAMYVYRRLG